MAQFFPARVYAIAIPATLLVLAIAIVALFIGVVLVSRRARRRGRSE